MVTETICLQCGSRGFENAFVYCIRCLKFAVHRYCLDEIPETLDEFVCWLCDDCELKVRKRSALFEHDAIPCQARHNKVSNSTKSFFGNGMEKSDLVIVENEHVCKDASEQACDGCAKIDSVEYGELASQHSPVELDDKNDENPILLPVDVSAISQQTQQLEEEKIEGDLIGSIELSASCLTGSTTKKDQLMLATASYDECVKVDISECTKTMSDSTIPSLVKVNGCSEQKEEEEKKMKRKRRKRNIVGSATEKDQNILPTASFDECVEVDFKECTRSASDLTLHSKVKENGGFEQKDQEEKKIENKKKSRSGKSGGRRGENITESNTEKVQHRLATSYDECVKVDNKECTRSASDSTLLSKVKENDSSEQKNQEEKKIENEKKIRRGKNITESNTEKVQHRLATSYDECVKVDNKECTRLASDSTLLSKVKENDSSEQKDQEEKKIEKKKKRKREKNISESTTEKVKHRLATSYNECVKVDNKECTRLESDTTELSKVKENDSSEQKDEEEEKKIENKKKRKREKNIIESLAEKVKHRLAMSCNEFVEVDNKECTILASDSILLSKVKENGCSDQKGHEEKKIENKKKRRKREKNIMGSATEKDQHRLAAASHDEHVKADISECTRLGSDSALPSKVKENGCSEQKDQEKKKKIKDKRERERKRMQNTMGSTTEIDQHRLATTASHDEHVKADISECTRLGSDSTLPSKLKENGCSEQKDQEKKKIEDKRKRERKRTQNTMGSTTKIDQHRLAAASHDEHVKADISECTRLGSDSTLPSKLKENGCSEQKDQEKKKIEDKRERERKRTQNTIGSTTKIDQHRLAAASHYEHVKADISECTRLGSDSTLPSKLKENGSSEQKDQEKKKIEDKRERERKRTQNTMGSTTEIDQHRLAAASHDEHVKADISECTRLGSDSALPSKLKENGCSEQKDQEKKKIEDKRERERKRMQNTMGSTTEIDQHRLAAASHDEHVKADISECTRLGSDSALPSKLKENGCSEQKGQEKKKIEDKRARERKRMQNTMGSTTEKDQHRLATSSHDEHVKADINGCTRLGSDSTLPSNVKENEGCEQKDQTCIPKPFDSATDLAITGACAADHPIISSGGPLKSSRKERTITSTETISQKQVHQTGVADVSTREKDLGSSSDRVENRGPEDKEEQTSTSYLKDLDYSVAQPIATPIWRGSFSILDSKYDNIDELLAHISNKACHKVYEAASQFQPVLCLEMLPKSDIWPKSFQTSEPNGDNIALYFFPSKIRNQVFEQLVEEMIHKELAFKGIMQNAELLIFTSTELPLRYWRFQNKYYLWGVFRGKQAAPSNPLSRVGEVAEIPPMRKRCDAWSPIGPLSNAARSGLGTS